MPAPRLLLAMAVAPFVAACVAPAGLQRAGGHQPDLDCPDDLAAYCGGWVVFDSDVPNANDHIAQDDQFVIGRKSNSRNVLSLFPRATDSGGLLIRWKGQQRVGLREITGADGSHECLVGRIRLTSHPGNGAPHEWHALTLRMDPIESPEIGPEDGIELCLEPQAGGGWPRACAPERCGLSDTADPRNHGGRAHARD